MITGSMIERKFRVVPETGEVFYCPHGQNWFPAGKTMAGNGYRKIGLCGKRVRTHKLIWVWCHGYWPKGELDHINGDRTDNRITNLREATVSQNRTNKKIQSNNKSGYKWVHFHRQARRWCAEIHTPRSLGLGRKRLHQSMHATAEEAYEAACAAARKLHGPFFNPG